MKPAALRLALTAVLFLGWVGYLAYLAVFARNPIVLSRPQFLVSQLDVIAHAEKDGGPDFIIDAVLYAQEPKDNDLKGKTIGIGGLDNVETPVQGAWRHDVAQFKAGRQFLLPLRPAAAPKDAAEDRPYYQVVPIPASPGYAGDAQGNGPAWAYPADPVVIRQYHTIPKPR